jgi:hypothetical protein
VLEGWWLLLLVVKIMTLDAGNTTEDYLQIKQFAAWNEIIWE